jgi:hypothetical protein
LFEVCILFDKVVPGHGNRVREDILICLVFYAPGVTLGERFVWAFLGAFLPGAVVPANIPSWSVFSLIYPSFSHKITHMDSTQKQGGFNRENRHYGVLVESKGILR